ncbi:hypothetical protein CTI12_AA117860 [Artemisia annua]|uniref:Uncharacterized protein n=1 Tax=Artemisia annua TaxID=35608 RepID=A0A2U1NB35_ARTAN|nr:hypothetical protein CTI12_AA117860 [Artemisia annua]
MGFDTRFCISFVALCCLCLLRGIQAMDNSELRLLDDLFQEYAQKSFPRQPRTGLLYNVSLPSNFTGVEVSIVRLRRGSFLSKGANYSDFFMPPRIYSVPIFTRLDIVYSNLGNLSSYYYNVPNYTFIAPVVGFNTYGSTNTTGPIGNLSSPVTKLNLTLFGDSILVKFHSISLQQREKVKCVMFYSNGMFEMANMTLQNMCAVRDQGHFSIVEQTPPSIPLGPKEKGSATLWRWWVFGFAVGVFGLLLFGFIIIMTIRIYRMRKIGKMEKEAEKNEGLDATNVGQSKMPIATFVRTQPALEHDYFP